MQNIAPENLARALGMKAVKSNPKSPFMKRTTVYGLRFAALCLLAFVTSTTPAVQPIHVSVDGKLVNTIPGDYVPLDYPNMPWRGDPAIGISAKGEIYTSLYRRIYCSTDEGRTWSSTDTSRGLEMLDIGKAKGYTSFGVLRDGTLIWAFQRDKDIYITRSSNKGKQWDVPVKLDRGSYPQTGGSDNCITELRDGTLLIPVRLDPWLDDPRHPGRQVTVSQLHPLKQIGRGMWKSNPWWTTHVYRSADAGHTWGEPSPLAEWGVETNILELRSGRLLAAIRINRPLLPGDSPDTLVKSGAGEGWNVYKTVFLAESTDKGRTWSAPWPVRHEPDGPNVMAFGDAHGHLVELSDGTVVLVHDHRYPYIDGGVWARVSHDQGKTWNRRIYQISRGAGYGASVILEDDTIVTVCGNTPLDKTGQPLIPWRAQSVRWRLP